MYYVLYKHAACTKDLAEVAGNAPKFPLYRRYLTCNIELIHHFQCMSVSSDQLLGSWGAVYCPRAACLATCRRLELHGGNLDEKLVAREKFSDYTSDAGNKCNRIAIQYAKINES